MGEGTCLWLDDTWAAADTAYQTRNPNKVSGNKIPEWHAACGGLRQVPCLNDGEFTCRDISEGVRAGINSGNRCVECGFMGRPRCQCARPLLLDSLQTRAERAGSTAQELSMYCLQSL